MILYLMTTIKNFVECEFRNVSGYIKFEFDKRDLILPRSILSFYTSQDSNNWDMVGIFKNYW